MSLGTASNEGEGECSEEDDCNDRNECTAATHSIGTLFDSSSGRLRSSNRLA